MIKLKIIESSELILKFCGKFKKENVSNLHIKCCKMFYLDCLDETGITGVVQFRLSEYLNFGGGAAVFPSKLFCFKDLSV